MKSVAVLDGTLVVNVIVRSDDDTLAPNEVAYTLANPAVIGGDYIEGFFYVPQPYPSWTREAGRWVAPVPMPSEGSWEWDEAAQEWRPLSVIN